MRLTNQYAIRSKALIYEGELNYLSRCVLDYPNIETGGDLFGFWTHSGFPVVQYVIGPGKDSNHAYAFFNQDEAYLQEMGDLLREQHGLQHIGEWHSHHRIGLAEPSGHDISTVRKALNEYHLHRFYLVIANIRQGSTTINGFMFQQENPQHDVGAWVVLPGESPIRENVDRVFTTKVYQPKTAHPSIVDLSETSLHHTQYVKPIYQSHYWLNNRDNHRVLQGIITQLKNRVEVLSVHQELESKRVYLQFQYEGRNWRVHFNEDFPENQPELLCLNDPSFSAGFPFPVWNNQIGLAEATLAFLYSSLNIPN
jgi:hypothetical protein